MGKFVKIFWGVSFVLALIAARIVYLNESIPVGGVTWLVALCLFGVAWIGAGISATIGWLCDIWEELNDD